MVGVWTLRSPEDQRRLDGSLMDGVVLEAIKSGGVASGLSELAGEAIQVSSSLLDYQLLIPSVDADSGLFAAYRLISNSTSSGPGASHEGHAFIDVKRIVGAAYAGPDGEIYWQAAENVDTATYQGYLPPGEGWMDVLRVEGVEVWTEDGKRTLDDQSVLQIRLYREDGDDVVAAAVEKLGVHLPLVVLKAGQSYVS